MPFFLPLLERRQELFLPPGTLRGEMYFQRVKLWQPLPDAGHQWRPDLPGHGHSETARKLWVFRIETLQE